MTASTRPPRCISAASRRGRTSAIPAPVYGPGGADGRRSRRRQPQGHPQRRGSGARARWAGARRRRTTAAQILYFLAENLEYRSDEFAKRLREQTGESIASAQKEVAASVERLFAFAGWADKYDGAVHNPPSRTIAIAMVEPIGVMGIVAPPSRPLLGSIALLAPALAMGNPVVLVPSRDARRCR